MNGRWKDLTLVALIFISVGAVYLLSGNHVPIDSKWSIYTALSVLREGNTDLDEYRPLIAEINEPYDPDTNTRLPVTLNGQTTDRLLLIQPDLK